MIKILKKIFALLVLLAIISVSSIGEINANQGMRTYTNETYGFSIDCPEDWRVGEDVKGIVVGFDGPKKDGFITSMNILTQDISPEMSAEDFVAIEGHPRLFFKDPTWFDDFNDTINGEQVAGYIYTYKKGWTKPEIKGFIPKLKGLQ